VKDEIEIFPVARGRGRCARIEIKERENAGAWFQLPQSSRREGMDGLKIIKIIQQV
jgi:hypothetical protein